MNQFHPWKDLGITELQYWKRKYVEAEQRNKVLEEHNETLRHEFKMLQAGAQRLSEENKKLKSRLDDLGTEYAIVCHFKQENEILTNKLATMKKRMEIAQDAVAAWLESNT